MSRFGRIKDAATMIQAAPVLVDQAQELAEQARQLAAAQQAVFTGGAVAPGAYGPYATGAGDVGLATRKEV